MLPIVAALVYSLPTMPFRLRDPFFSKDTCISYAIDRSVFVGYATCEDMNDEKHPVNPTVRFVGGSIERDLNVYNRSKVIISGGSIGSQIVCADHSTVAVIGGSVRYGIHAANSSTVNISGGSTKASMYVSEHATLNLFGTGLSKTLTTPNLDGGGCWSQYTLHGRLRDGTSVNGWTCGVDNDGHARLLLHNAPMPLTFQRKRRVFSACALPLAYDKGDLEELSVAVSARPLGADELRGLSDADLTLLRNVPFARHGYRFLNPKLLDYFSNKSWYRPNTDSDSVAERRCSRIENRNVNAIIAFQKRQRGDTSGAAMQESGMSLAALLTSVSERNLRESDLNDKTAWQLTILRNTPYARHGFRFGSAKLTNYFRGKAWYRPDSGDQDVVSGRFNPFERRNVKFIADFQDANGLRDMP